MEKCIVVSGKDSDTVLENYFDEIVLTSNFGVDLKEQVRLMIEIALKRGWKLQELVVKGSIEFIAEMTKQILLADDLHQSHTLSNDERKIIDASVKRPKNYLDQVKRDFNVVNHGDRKKKVFIKRKMSM